MTFLTHSIGYRNFINIFRTEEVAVLVIASHEAKHVKHNRNGKLGGNITLALSHPTEYQESIIEREAWDESLHVLKHFYPDFYGYIETDEGTRYNFPQKSKYD